MIFQDIKKTSTNKNEVVIYQAKSGAIEIKKDVRANTVWATQAQIAEIFRADRSVITKHIRNILADKELDADAVCAKFAHTGTDGKTYQVQFYNLDIILAVGYRTNSTRAIEFRKWATRTLRRYIVDGYAINKRRIAQNYVQFLEAVESIKLALPAGTSIDTSSVLELVSAFADTWLSLKAYDTDTLPDKGNTKASVILTAEQLIHALSDFKSFLIQKGEAMELFGQERQRGVVAGIVGNVMQSFDGKDLYPTIEEKAAHLLYFMVKNHPFTDGNKRSGAYTFIWFLQKAGLLNQSNLTPSTLTALTLLIAESEPRNKERMIRLILQLLKK